MGKTGSKAKRSKRKEIKQKERRLITERLAQDKGAHPLTTDSNCIACVNTRKLTEDFK